MHHGHGVIIRNKAASRILKSRPTDGSLAAKNARLRRLLCLLGGPANVRLSHDHRLCSLPLSRSLPNCVDTVFFLVFFWSLGKHSKTHFKTASCLPWPHWKTIRAHRGEVGGWVGVRWGWGVSTNAWGVASTWKRTVWDSKRPFFSIEFFPQCILFKQRQLTPLNRLRSCRPCGLWTYNFFFFFSLSHMSVNSERFLRAQWVNLSTGLSCDLFVK